MNFFFFLLCSQGKSAPGMHACKRLRSCLLKLVSVGSWMHSLRLVMACGKLCKGQSERHRVDNKHLVGTRTLLLISASVEGQRTAPRCYLKKKLIWQKQIFGLSTWHTFCGRSWGPLCKCLVPPLRNSVWGPRVRENQCLLATVH